MFPLLVDDDMVSMRVLHLRCRQSPVGMVVPSWWEIQVPAEQLVDVNPFVDVAMAQLAASEMTAEASLQRLQVGIPEVCSIGSIGGG